MSANEYLIDTNILIYHTKGSQHTIAFITDLINRHAFNISILTKIEFLGWDKHTSDGYEKCKRLLDRATIYSLDDTIADKTIELKRKLNIKLADAIMAATAILNNLKLLTRNVDDFKVIDEIEVTNLFESDKTL